MGKTCWVCRNTEDFFLAQKEELLKSIQSEIKECESFEENILEETRDRLGFTDERKDKVRNIGSAYSCILVVAWLLGGGNLYFGFRPDTGEWAGMRLLKPIFHHGICPFVLLHCRQCIPVGEFLQLTPYFAWGL